MNSLGWSKAEPGDKGEANVSPPNRGIGLEW